MMKNKVEMKPSTLLAPVPAVMVSCGDGESAPNIVTIAWAGTVCSEPPMLSISVRPSRHSFGIIERSREFVVNLVGEPLLQAMDWCGVKSGRDVDKFAHWGLTPLAVEGLAHAPAIAEAPLSLGCKVTQIIPLGTHHLFLAEIVKVLVEPSLMDENDALHLGRAGLIAFGHGEYANVGKSIGFHGFSVASPEALKRRMAALQKE
jgi:flavin reductase (DIM6/NTAB) family NADH-FMN oxidoreductase RutF